MRDLSHKSKHADLSKWSGPECLPSMSQSKAASRPMSCPSRGHDSPDGRMKHMRIYRKDGVLQTEASNKHGSGSAHTGLEAGSHSVLGGRELLEVESVGWLWCRPAGQCAKCRWQGLDAWQSMASARIRDPEA